MGLLSRLKNGRASLARGMGISGRRVAISEPPVLPGLGEDPGTGQGLGARGPEEEDDEPQVVRNVESLGSSLDTSTAASSHREDPRTVLRSAVGLSVEDVDALARRGPLSRFFSAEGDVVDSDILRAAVLSAQCLDVVEQEVLRGTLEGQLLQHIAACTVTSAVQICAARSIAAKRRAEAREELVKLRELRHGGRQFLRAQVEIQQSVLREVSSRLVGEGVRRAKLPAAVVRVQAMWRGALARRRLGRRRERARRAAMRRVARERAVAAAEAIERDKQAAQGRHGENTRRREWARTEYRDGGKLDLKNHDLEYEMHEFVDSPPKGQPHGVRVTTETLPLNPGSPDQQHRVGRNPNTWLGVPVKVKPASPPPKRLGPPMRPSQLTQRDRDEAARNSDYQAGLKYSYSWVPVKCFGGALAQATLSNSPSRREEAGGTAVFTGQKELRRDHRNSACHSQGLSRDLESSLFRGGAQDRGIEDESSHGQQSLPDTETVKSFSAQSFDRQEGHQEDGRGRSRGEGDTNSMFSQSTTSSRWEAGLLVS